MDLIYSGVVLILFAALALVGIKKKGVTSDTELLSRYNNLRTFFAMEIIIGHSIKNFHTPLALFENFLCISVAFFFFVSAYGLALSYDEKEGYLKGFIISKCGYIFLINLVAYIFSVIIAVISRVDTIFYTGPKGLLINLFTASNWYIWELIGFYALFYLIYRFVPKLRWLVALIIVIAMVVIMYVCKVFEPYYTASLAFPFGILLGEHNQKVQKLLKNRYVLCCIIAFVVMAVGMSCFVVPNGSIVKDVFLRNIMGIGTIMVLGVFLYQLAIGNPALRWLKTYTTEIYIFQFIWLQIAAGLGFDYKLKLPFVLVTTIITALIMHKVFVALKRVCSPKAMH